MFKTGEMFRTETATIEIIDAWTIRKGGKLRSMYEIYLMDFDKITTTTGDRLSAMLKDARQI